MTDRWAPTDRWKVIGMNGSPYSVKMRAIMRYRRLPFDWEQRLPQMTPDEWSVRPLVIPIVVSPDGAQRVDSTPIALELDDMLGDGREILPPDPAMRFLTLLIEDFADEWMTKPMFWYRWARQADIDHAARWLTADRMPFASAEERAARAHEIEERQIGRMPLVGCTPENAPVIESSYRETLAALNAAVGDRGFLFGSRPSLADFGLFGMMMQLGTDPTPAAIMQSDAPEVPPWMRRLDDASGILGSWEPETFASSTIADLLKVIGTVYLPFLDANEKAVETGSETVEVVLNGHTYRQAPFKYQVKCLNGLRQAFAALPAEDRKSVEKRLVENGADIRPLAGERPILS